MKGSIKFAAVSIKYKLLVRKRYERHTTKPIMQVIVINEEKRILKKKTTVIKRVCRDLGLNYDKMIDPDINSIDIKKDLGKTVYEID